MIFYVYKTIRKSTGEYYIGKRCFSGKNIVDDKYVGSGTMLKKKYSKDPSDWYRETICECKSRKELSKSEKKYLGDLWETDPKCLNLKPGGDGGRTPGLFLGEKHHAHDSKIYTFFFRGIEKFTGTRLEAQMKYEIKKEGLRQIVKGHDRDSAALVGV